jgi:hypothetical protein
MTMSIKKVHQKKPAMGDLSNAIVGHTHRVGLTISAHACDGYDREDGYIKLLLTKIQCAHIACGHICDQILAWFSLVTFILLSRSIILLLCIMARH